MGILNASGISRGTDIPIGSKLLVEQFTLGTLPRDSRDDLQGADMPDRLHVLWMPVIVIMVMI